MTISPPFPIWGSCTGASAICPRRLRSTQQALEMPHKTDDLWMRVIRIDCILRGARGSLPGGAEVDRLTR